MNAAPAPEGLSPTLSLCFRSAIASPASPPTRISVLPTATVRSLKQTLAAALNLQGPGAFELVYRDAVLPERDTLAKCNVSDGSAITVVVRIATSRSVRRSVVEGTHPHLSQYRPLGKVTMSWDTPRAAATKAVLQTKARSLIARGVSGIVVVPGAVPGTRRVMLINQECLALLKRMKAAKEAAGEAFLGEGSDEDVLHAMRIALGEVQAPAAAGSQPPEHQATSVNPDASTGEAITSPSDAGEGTSRTHVLLAKILQSSERRKEAIRRAVSRREPHTTP